MNLTSLARFAVARTLFAPTSLNEAIARLGYVQADPIRAPARAQDLILRHRVADYRIDDLEAQYPHLDVFEDVLHNYGFFPNALHPVLYPRPLSARWQTYMAEHPTLRQKVLRYLEESDEAHPREVERAVGASTRINGWGGTSSASTMMLEGLLREGRARVVLREAGIRVYARAERRLSKDAWSTAQRANALVHLLVNLYAPISRRSLAQTLRMAGSYKPDVDYAARVQTMVKRGELTSATVDGIEYLWPATEAPAKTEAEDSVRLLAPFDPLVWDRSRFEHLWGWPYRFEAYTPAAKRQWGYYALPLLWRDQVIGWATVERNAKHNKAKVTVGFIAKKPREVAFRQALERERESFGVFLRVQSSHTLLAELP